MLFLILSFVILFLGCDDSKQKINNWLLTTTQNQIANGFKLSQNQDSIFLDIPHSKFAQIPLQKIKKNPSKILVLSSTFIPFLNSLNQSKTIIGVSDGRYISDTLIHQKILDKTIYSYNSNSNIDREWLLINPPDLIITYVFSKQDSTQLKQLKDLKINTLILQPFEETHPLGRVEWLKVFGALFDQNQKADSIFNSIKNNYESIRTKTTSNSPTILAGSPFEGVWWVPGGQSLSAKIIEDAGANYLFAADSHAVAFPIDFENILANGSKIDFWINTNPFRSLRDIEKFDTRFRHIKALQTKNIFSHEKSKRDWGSDNFYEEGVFRPDLVLADLKAIFSNKYQVDSLNYYLPLP